MKKQIAIKNEYDVPVNVVLIDNKGAKDRRPMRVRRIGIDASFLRNDPKEHLNYLRGFNGAKSNGDRVRFVVESAIAHEIEDLWTPPKEEKDEKDQVVAFIREDDVLRVDLEHLVDGDPRRILLDRFYSFEGMLPKKIAYDDFIRNFNIFYELCVQAVNEVIDIPTRPASRWDRIDKGHDLADSIWRIGRGCMYGKPRSQDGLEPVVVETINYLFHALLQKLPLKVYTAMLEANDRNGHILDFEGLERGTTLGTTPKKFKKYWVNTYLNHVKLLFGETLKYVICGLAPERIKRELDSRFERSTQNDMRVIASTITGIQSQNYIAGLVYGDKDIETGAICATMIEKKR
ncbi:TPA: hypothetical protein HA246_03370 [Candidatus Woesearchaeota archaeon]|nr:hypothetical protein [Candidatus Woesearchaeota archaeon]